MTQQPEALRLANELESYIGRPVCTEAAAELRRLHEFEVGYGRMMTAAEAHIAALETALRQAVEALEQIAAYRPLTFAECSDAEAVMGIAERAIIALRERLAQPETVVAEYKFQTYAAYKTDGEMKIGVVPAMKEGKDFTISKPWVGLTATEVHETEGYEEDRKLYRFARAIEAKLKEKNA